MEFIIDFLKFLKKRKKLWLSPILFIIILIGSLIVITEGTVVAPFIYTLF